VPVLCNVEKYFRARQATGSDIIWRMRFACCVTKTANTNSDYVVLIAFPWQQWLRERNSMLGLSVHLSLLLLETNHSAVYRPIWQILCVWNWIVIVAFTA